MEIQQLILEILQGNVKTRSGDNVPVVIRYFPLDKTPCITINSEGGRPVDEPFVIVEPQPVTAEHPDYDPKNPNNPILQDVYYQKTTDTVIVHLWYNDKSDRNYLLEQVKTQLFLARIGDYRFCTNYNKDNHYCKTLNNICKAYKNNRNGLAVKGFCPKPEEYGYKGILYEHYVLPTTFKIEAIYNQDEYDKKPVLYHKILKLDVQYYNRHIIGGKTWNPDNFKVV